MKRYAISGLGLLAMLSLSEAARADDAPSPPLPAPGPSEPREEAPLTLAPAPAAAPLSLSLRAPSPAPAYAAPGLRDEPSEDAPAYTPSKPNAFFRFGLGARVTYAPNEGLDPFTESDAIGQVSFEVSRTLLTRGRASLALGLGWDVGAKRTKARGLESDLTHHRVMVPIEGRFHLASWIYGFGKVAPGVSLLALAVKDPGAPTDLTDLRPGFALDASVGASFLVIGHGPADHKKVRLWATPEIGYGLTTASRPTLTTDTREDVLGQEEGAAMAPVAVRGMFFRLGVGLTY